MTRAIILFFMLTGIAAAQAPQYCAMFYDGGRACGIPSLDQCQQTVRGVGGTCGAQLSFSLGETLADPQHWNC